MRRSARKWKTTVLGGVDPRYCPSLPRRGLEGGEAGTGVQMARGKSLHLGSPPSSFGERGWMHLGASVVQVEGGKGARRGRGRKARTVEKARSVRTPRRQAPSGGRRGPSQPGGMRSRRGAERGRQRPSQPCPRPPAPDRSDPELWAEQAPKYPAGQERSRGTGEKVIGIPGGCRAHSQPSAPAVKRASGGSGCADQVRGRG